MGNKRSNFFAPKSTIWSPPKPLQSLAVNTEPMECNASLSPSPVPPPILPDITDVGVLTSPVPTSTVSCYIDSFADSEFAALLKDNEEVDCLQQTLAARRAELGKQKALFARLERAFNKLKENYEQISQSLSAQTHQNKLDARNIADLQDTISDLRKQNALLQSDQHAVSMHHQLLATLIAPDMVYLDNVTPTTFLYTILTSRRSTLGPDFEKTYLSLMRLCHPDRHPGIDRHISQQLTAVHNILTDPVIRKIYDCCGVRSVTRKDTAHFCQLCNPRHLYESFIDLWK